MANMLALFDDAQRLEAAENALRGAGHAADVIRVFRASDPPPARTERSASRSSEMHVVSQQGEIAATGAPTGTAADFGLEPFGDVGDYFLRAHEEGAHLMVLSVADPERARRALEEAGAQRVHAI